MNELLIVVGVSAFVGHLLAAFSIKSFVLTPYMFVFSLVLVVMGLAG